MMTTRTRPGALPSSARTKTSDSLLVLLARAQQRFAIEDIRARRHVKDVEEARRRIAILDDLDGKDLDLFDDLSGGVRVDRAAEDGERACDRRLLVGRVRAARRRRRLRAGRRCRRDHAGDERGRGRDAKLHGGPMLRGAAAPSTQQRKPVE
jgi:hypothetical protein